MNLSPAHVAYRLRRAQIIGEIEHLLRVRPTFWRVAVRDLRHALVTARRTLRQAEAATQRRVA